MMRQLVVAASVAVGWLLVGFPIAGTGQSPPPPTVGPTADPVGLPASTVSPPAAGLLAGAAAKDTIGFSAPAARGGQLITLVNTSQQWMAVYHIDGSGQIHLISSRPISQDFAVQYNATAPLPKEMREIAGR